ncbi:hypothetical protein ABZ816_26940 [Actinosynnema sp. NPDC047251]|uniref:hypothetical protein n=1 Tax=Saccharothrix espanaensis TaxID=103731 RepID=UPI0007C5B8B7|nr:hypothetical protein [Saccharothrix espanaensis]
MATVVATCAALVGGASAQPPSGIGWQRIGEGITAGVSGVAVTGVVPGAFSALVVRDNKNPGENRLARAELRRGRVVAVRPVRWDGPEPVDLEAIEQYPSGAGDEFLAVDSLGNGFHLRVRDLRATVLRTFHLPAGQAGDNYESFALTRSGSGFVALWADRGQDERPATLYSAPLDLAGLTFGPTAAATVRVPFPVEHVRHISDIHITGAGVVLASSAADPGDDGPFDSALYDLGRVTAGKVVLRAAPETRGAFIGHKVEAVDCLSPRCEYPVLGTDDESAGGSLWI